MKTFLIPSLVIALAGTALSAAPASLEGTYVEARTAEIFAGGCVINSEAGTSGREAVLAWNVDRGQFNGVALDGLTVMAAVSGDVAFAAATRADDLYAPVAAALGVDRPVAKIAVLAAMYGQRSGTAGQALAGMQRAYPTAIGYLDAADRDGQLGRDVRTYGGRLIRTGDDDSLAGLAPEAERRARAARGRYARNAVVQGAAAELFKAWAATVRATTRDLGAEVVLCLHDELLVHAPVEHAAEVAARVDRALEDASRRWAGGAPVRPGGGGTPPVPC